MAIPRDGGMFRALKLAIAAAAVVTAAAKSDMSMHEERFESAVLSYRR